VVSIAESSNYRIFERKWRSVEASLKSTPCMPQFSVSYKNHNPHYEDSAFGSFKPIRCSDCFCACLRGRSKQIKWKNWMTFICEQCFTVLLVGARSLSIFWSCLFVQKMIDDPINPRKSTNLLLNLSKFDSFDSIVYKFFGVPQIKPNPKHLLLVHRPECGRTTRRT
jgi:hypothetical protein